MQTILGAGGIIGTELAKELLSFTQKIRLVGRNPEKVNSTDELFRADLLQQEDVYNAVAGSEVAYLTVGLNYSAKVWESSWPLIMKNVIEACKLYKVRLVFFDNIYMYDPSQLGHMTENTPIRPTSRKGKVRAQIAKMLLDEVSEGKLDALIARSADFYGPSIKNVCLLTETVFNNLSTGKKANWMMSLDHIHTFTYTPDAAKATALLGNTKDAFNTIWHLPTSQEAVTGRMWIELIAKELNKKPKVMLASKGMVRLLGLFVPVMREFVEMLYQYDRDYVFDSSKFENRFKMKPTPYLQGVRTIVQTDYLK